MAEIFGIVSGALGVAGLFNNCVDCFEYIQFGRHFGQDFERCQLRLDVAGNRLARWGTSVGINEDPRFQPNAPTDKAAKLARAVLRQVLLQFNSAYEVSQKYEITADDDDLVVLRDSALPVSSQRAHNHFKAFIKRRHDRTSLVKKTAWALYDKKNLEGIVDKIVVSIEELEQVFPAQVETRHLVQMEIEEIEDEPTLKSIKDAADKIDLPLSSAAGKKLAVFAGSNSAERFQLGEDSRMNVGAVVTNSALGVDLNIKDTSKNAARDFSTQKGSRVQVGTTYGGKSIWDD